MEQNRQTDEKGGILMEVLIKASNQPNDDIRKKEEKERGSTCLTLWFVVLEASCCLARPMHSGQAASQHNENAQAASNCPGAGRSTDLF